MHAVERGSEWDLGVNFDCHRIFGNFPVRILDYNGWGGCQDSVVLFAFICYVSYFCVLICTPGLVKE